MDQMHDDKWWLMTSMGEMYKCMGISVPPHPLPQVYLDQGPFFTQQPDPCHSLSSPSRPCLWPVLYSARPFHATFSSVRSDHAPLSYVRPFHVGSRHILYVAQPHPVLGVARTLRRKSSLSLTRIDDDSGLCYHYMMQYCTNN
ncbi:hypothetical protein Hdeb2414_s0024g00653811 [Helianthus debilis subsp. tardiflorus]